MKKRKCGSITVEASLIFPVFFLACMAFCSLFLYLKTEYTVQRTMLYAARSVSQFGDIVEPVVEARKKYLSEIDEKIQSATEENRLLKEAVTALAEKLIGVDEISLDALVSGMMDSVVVGALVEARLPAEITDCIPAGIDYDGSVLFDEDKCIHIICNYRLGAANGLFKNIGIPVRQELKYRYFLGTEVKSLLEEEEPEEEEPGEEPEEEEEEPEEIVLITDTGYVYHLSYNCPSLNIRPKIVNYEDVGSMRNDGGAKYYPCEYCVKKNAAPKECYITPEGDRYHFKKDCQGLKRTIYEVPLSEAGNKRPCKRCAKKKEAAE